MSTQEYIEVRPDSGHQTHAGKQNTPERRRRRSRTIRAILAGGLVLGVGAAVTLAAWNDSAFVTGSFTAGTFKLEGAITNGAYLEYDTTPGGTLDFTLPAAGLSPGDSFSAPFAVRLSADTTVGGTVAVSTDTTSGTITNLTYDLDVKDAWGCGAATTSTPISGEALGAGTAGLTVAAGSPVSNPGAPVFLCFTVHAGSGLAQGQSGSATWKFVGTSS